MSQNKIFKSVVRIEWGGNNFNAKNKKEYIEKVKELYFEQYGIKLEDNEIKNIEEVEEEFFS